MSRPKTPKYDPTARITRKIITVALIESHKLLCHYAKLLNMHDGGKREIPKDFYEFIKRFSKEQR